MTTELLPAKQPGPTPDTGRVVVSGSRSERSDERADEIAVEPVAAANVVIGPEVLERAARVIRVLGHPLRLRLLETLEAGERNVTDLVLATGANQALVSQHLAILRAEDVVGFRRDGGRIYYRITEPKVHSILDCIRACDLPELGPDRAGAPFAQNQDT